MVVPTSPTKKMPNPKAGDIASMGMVPGSALGSSTAESSPGFAGAVSPTYDRVLLEAGQDLAKTPSVVQSSKNFVSQLETPIFPWTSFTLVVILGVVAAAVGTRFLQVRARKAGATAAPVNGAETTTE